MATERLLSLEERWQIFREKALPPYLPEGAVVGLRRAFFAGAVEMNHILLYEVRTIEQAKPFVQEMVDFAEEARAACEHTRVLRKAMLQ